MNLFQEIHSRALIAVRKYGEAEAELLNILQEADTHKVFRHFQCTSLFGYAVERLGLSESVALNFIAVARKAKEVPALMAEIESGSLTVSKARKITAVLTLQNQEGWIEKAKTLPQKALEKEVARVAPREATPERAKYVTETRLNLSIGVSENFMQKLKRTQDLLSQKERRSVSMEEALEAALGGYLEKHDPVKKAERAKQTTLVKHVARHTIPGQRERLGAAVLHAVNLRDQGQCGHLDPRGKRCSNQRWTQIHHKIPVEHGGGNHPENLETLCHEHHRQVHLGLTSCDKNK